MKTLKASVLSIAFVFSASSVAHGQAASSAISAATTLLPVLVASGAAAGTFGATCKAPTGQWACPLAALAIVQVIGTGKARSGAQTSAAQLTDTPIPSTSFETQPTVYTLTDGSTISGDSAKAANALNAEGLPGLANSFAQGVKAVDASGTSVSADGKTVTLPNGKKVDSSAYSSTDGMKKSGMTDGQIQSMNDASASIAKTANDAVSKVASLTNDQGGGGGGGGLGSRGGSGGDGGSGGAGGDLYGKLNASKAKDNGLSGLSKKHGTDNIGVEGDDIWEMVSRRYQSRDKADAFLKN